VIADGNWKTAVYIDEHANDQQREALSQILSGTMGGPMERCMRLTGQ
jgi:hypothetical protein